MFYSFIEIYKELHFKLFLFLYSSVYCFGQVDSNQKINSCDKGCGGKIYFDQDFKTEEGKFIPIDKNTGRPHKCKRIPVRKKKS